MTPPGRPAPALRAPGAAGAGGAAGRAVPSGRVRTLLGDPAVALRIREGLRRRAGTEGLRRPWRPADPCRDDGGGLRLSAPGGSAAGPQPARLPPHLCAAGPRGRAATCPAAF